MGDIYIALLHCDLDWTEKEVAFVEKMWKGGYSITDIAKKVRRPIKDVFVLIYDRAELGYLKPRKGSVFGDM